MMDLVGTIGVFAVASAIVIIIYEEHIRTKSSKRNKQIKDDLAESHAFMREKRN